ncbi:alpha/beta hydrolase [Streptomyces sp. NPDC059578]|uniref:alpha/beta hydrolase n=1 Tax=Streptomyces sp. NPDC059578 TaxID=3346874 RepID=UPI003673DE66
MSYAHTRRAVLAGAAALGTTGSSWPRPAPVGSARIVGERRVDERLVELTVDSPALGDRSTVALLTPRGWDRRRPEDRWPTLYLLAGGDGDHTTWTTLFRVQDLHELQDVLVVMPGMPSFGFWTDWWNHGERGAPRVRTYFLREVLRLVEGEYGADQQRAAAGESQGGFGALGMAARVPGLFGAVAAFGAPVHPIRHPEMWLSGAKSAGVDGYAVFGDPWEQWKLWLDWDPYHRAEGLRRTPVHLACGDGTPGPLDGREPDPHIPGTEKWAALADPGVVSLTEAVCAEEARLLAGRLASLGAPVTTHLYPGTHGGTYGHRELRRALPMLLDALGPRGAAEGVSREGAG